MRAACLVGLLAATASALADVKGQPVNLPSQSAATFSHEGVEAVYLLEFRRPVLLLAWSADDEASLTRAVPAALELQARYAGDLVVLFEERSGLSYEDMLRFACRKRWLAAPALWTSEPIEVLQDKAVPWFVLLSPAHVGLLEGDPLADPAALAKAVATAVDERRFGAPDLPAPARAAWRDLHDGELARALSISALADKLAARGDAAAADRLHAEAKAIELDIDQQLQLCTALTGSGDAAEGCERVTALANGLHDLPASHPLRERADSDVASYTCAAGLPHELKASEQLVKLRDRLLAKGPDASLAAQLEKFAAAYPGTHAADRATRLARLAKP